MNEIESIIMKAFGEKREALTEMDLEKIMNTKMITNENAAGAAQRSDLPITAPVPTRSKLSELFEGIKKAQESKGPEVELSTVTRSSYSEQRNESLTLEMSATRRFSSLRTFQPESTPLTTITTKV